ncbi:MAG: M48 family metallopeptidase [Terriglobales bacterium]
MIVLWAGTALWAAVPRSVELARARQYWYGGLFWGVLAQLWMFVVLYLMVRTGWALRLRRWTERHWLWRAARIAVFTAVALTVLAVAEFPFSLYLSYIRERDFGFERQTVGGWLADWAKSYGVELVAIVLAAWVLYWVLGRARGVGRWGAARNGPRAAVRVWIPCVILMVAAVAIEPVFIAPLFYRFTPMRPSPLRAELLAMARRAGIPARVIYVQHSGHDSSHTNAYVVGLLGTQRIVVYDTLLASDTPAEVEFVVAHEMGHYAMHHIWRGTLFGAAILLGFLLLSIWLYGRWFPGLGYRGLDDVAGLPLMALLLSGMFFLAAPGINAFSRHLEHEADAYGLRHCPDPAAAITSFRQDLRSDLIVPNPPHWVVWWFFDHPADAQRIAYAERYCRRHGIAIPPARTAGSAAGGAALLQPAARQPAVGVHAAVAQKRPVRPRALHRR